MLYVLTCCRHVANGEILGVSLLMEDVLMSGRTDDKQLIISNSDVSDTSDDDGGGDDDGGADDDASSSSSSSQSHSLPNTNLNPQIRLL